LSPEDNSPRRLGLPATSLNHRGLRDSYATAAPSAEKAESGNPEKVSPPMSNYLSAIFIFLLVLSPLFVPLAVTLVPMASTGIRRVAKVVGPKRPAVRFA
jgi:hypothetical protein